MLGNLTRDDDDGRVILSLCCFVRARFRASDAVEVVFPFFFFFARGTLIEDFGSFELSTRPFDASFTTSSTTSRVGGAKDFVNEDDFDGTKTNKVASLGS